MIRVVLRRCALTFTSLILGLSAVRADMKDKSIETRSVPLPGGEAGIGFDDLGFAPGLHKVLVPGGRTGKLFLVDPDGLNATPVSGFSAEKNYGGGHGQGTTSADEGGGFLFATDRTAGTVNVVDPAGRKIISSTSLSGEPDYVRYVDSTQEVWVSEPDSEQIEIFKFSSERKPSLTRSASIAVPGGPESLIIDNTRSRAYTHLWAGSTVVIDLKKRVPTATWPNGCHSSRGVALDEKKGFLFVGCAEGKGVVLDVQNGGGILGSQRFGSGVDVIAYNPTLQHLYLPGAKSATLGILNVSNEGRLSLLGTADTAQGSHCAAADDQNQVWVCDPSHGRLLLVKDPFR